MLTMPGPHAAQKNASQQNAALCQHGTLHTALHQYCTQHYPVYGQGTYCCNSVEHVLCTHVMY